MAEHIDDEINLGEDHLADTAGSIILDGVILHDVAATSAPSAGKVCCVCGLNLKGKTRYKDKEGRYWCPDCGQADSQRKHPEPCPDCQQPVTKPDMLDFKGALVCPACHAKRTAAAKREEARLRALQEEERRQEQIKHRWKIAIVTALVVLALYGIVRLTWG